MKNVIDYLDKNFNSHLEDLKSLVRIPSVSFPGFPSENVKKSAHSVAELLKKRGLENVEILTLPDAHPYVYGEFIRNRKAPTVLLYAHHDVQPPGREELWRSPPFEPTQKSGPGGERLYGRGTADDKAGIIVHTSAIASFLEILNDIPVNIKLVIEGEEETGSTHLAEFLYSYRNRLNADVLVLTDSGNFDVGVPALTVALRGLVEVHVEVKALEKTIHSGMWGGPIPDPAIGLSKILARLVDEKGKIAIPGVLSQVRPLSIEEETRLRLVPYREDDFRKQSGMLKGVELLKEGPSPAVQVWRFPSLTVNAIQASSRKQAGNIINDSAWAKITIRLVDDMKPELVTQQLVDFLKTDVPWGLHVDVVQEASTGPWSTIPQGVAFDAAEAALKKGYGVAPVKIGCGGSIPFVKPFTEALGGVPALLIGVEDPYTDAHGENESLLISDFLKACKSQIYLFSELAERWRK